LIKAHALLNLWHREKQGEHTIIANDEDVKAGFWLYGLVARPNELGLSPQVYEIYESVIKPLVERDGTVDRQTILAGYYQQYGRFLSEEKLRREILPALEASGLVMQAPDPDDKRKMVVCTPHLPPISPPETIGAASGVHSLAQPSLDKELLKDKETLST
jgi:hypothetical protein